MNEITVEDIKRILSDVYSRSHEAVLDPSDIGDDALLFDYEGTGAENLEFDSLDALDVAAHLEDAYGIIAPNEIEPISLSTPRRITEFVTGLIEEGA